MIRRVDSSLLYELKRFGAVGAEKCFNCGNCTAICSLSSNEDPFPRRMIRLAQLGMKDELLGSKELGCATTAAIAPRLVLSRPNRPISWRPPVVTPSPTTRP